MLIVWAQENIFALFNSKKFTNFSPKYMQLTTMLNK